MARFDIYEAPIFNYYQDIINFNKEALRKPENDGRKTAGGFLTIVKSYKKPRFFKLFY